MYHVLIVDDMPDDAAALRALLMQTPYASRFSITTLTSLRDVAPGPVRLAAADILFMDICLDDGEGSQTGIDVIERAMLEGARTQVIYMSGFDAYHTQVYRTKHAGYLRKPFSRESVEEVCARAIAALESAAEKPLVVRQKGGERVLRPANIVYIESDRRRVRYHLRDEVVEAYGKISELAEILAPRFARCHQSFLVNLAYVDELTANEARLVTGDIVPVSRRWRGAVREALFAYMRDGG